MVENTGSTWIARDNVTLKGWSQLAIATLVFIFCALVFLYRNPVEMVWGARAKNGSGESGFNRYTGKVVDVLRDGPTLIVLDGYRRTTRVRLLGIPDHGQSPARQRACQKALIRLVSGHIFEIALREKDRHGYWRAQLMRDGRDINREDLPQFCGTES